MAGIKYTTLHWIIGWGIVAIMANSTNTDAGDIAAIIAAVFVVVGTLFGIIRWLCNRHRFKNPFEFTYLIPQSEYPEVQFEGAPDAEKKCQGLTIGIGHYRIIFQIQPKMNFTIDTVRFRFSGSTSHKPKDCGYNDPFIVGFPKDSLGRVHVRNWWGDIQPISQEGDPIICRKGTLLSTGREIETTGEWEGELIAKFVIKEAHDIEKILKFKVTHIEENDQIPFLKIK